MADVVRLYSKKPKAAEQRLANLLSEVLYLSLIHILPALNWIEKNFYKSICNENTTIKNMSKTREKEKRKKTKQFLKALGWILIIAEDVYKRQILQSLFTLL